MNKFVFLLCMLFLPLTINAQTWKIGIERLSVNGNIITRKLGMKPGHKVDIRKIVNPAHANYVTYKGNFLGGSSDSIKIDPYYGNFSQQPINLQGKIAQGIKGYNKGPISIAVSDVSYIHYRRFSTNTSDMIVAGVYLGVLGSLAALTITPLFCINFKEKTFNSDRYKNWAIGGAIGLVSSFAITVSAIRIDNKKYHFKFEVPGKNVKVWNFKYD